MHLSQPRRRLLPSILEPLVVALAFERGKRRVEDDFLFNQVVSPNVGFEDGVERGGFVACDLRVKVSQSQNDVGQ